MPIANVRGANINYEVLGTSGPWIALSPGGRRALDHVKSLARHVADAGYRVLIHDFAATPANSPSLHEFELISNWEKFRDNPGVKLAVICCPWPQYRDLASTAETRVFTPWQL